MSGPADLTGAPVNECCKDPANRIVVDSRPAPPSPGLEVAGAGPGTFFHRRCQVCGRNHYELEADPGLIGFSGAPMGGNPAAAGNYPAS